MQKKILHECNPSGTVIFMWNIHLIKIEKLKLFISLSFFYFAVVRKVVIILMDFWFYFPAVDERETRSQSSTFSLLFMVVQVWISAFDFWVRTGSFFCRTYHELSWWLPRTRDKISRLAKTTRSFGNWQLQTTDGRAARENEIFSIDKNQGSESRAKNKMRRKEITRISKSPSVQTV